MQKVRLLIVVQAGTEGPQGSHKTCPPVWLTAGVVPGRYWH
jgi:hypothetical protein